jgi:hypothetical protein
MTCMMCDDVMIWRCSCAAEYGACAAEYGACAAEDGACTAAYGILAACAGQNARHREPVAACAAGLDAL